MFYLTRYLFLINWLIARGSLGVFFILYCSDGQLERRQTTAKLLPATSHKQKGARHAPLPQILLDHFD